MLITPRKGKIITDRRIVDPIFMFVGAACACPAPSATLVLRNRRAKSSEIGNYICLAPMEKAHPIQSSDPAGHINFPAWLLSLRSAGGHDSVPPVRMGHEIQVTLQGRKILTYAED